MNKAIMTPEEFEVYARKEIARRATSLGIEFDEADILVIEDKIAGGGFAYLTLCKTFYRPFPMDDNSRTGDGKIVFVWNEYRQDDPCYHKVKCLDWDLTLWLRSCGAIVRGDSRFNFMAGYVFPDHGPLETAAR